MDGDIGVNVIPRADCCRKTLRCIASFATQDRTGNQKTECHYCSLLDLCHFMECSFVFLSAL